MLKVFLGIRTPFLKLAEKPSWVPAKFGGPHQFRHYNQTPGFVLEQLEPCMGLLAGFLYLQTREPRLPK
jgi:hypothetical protein